jgi:hypothetical protein
MHKIHEPKTLIDTLIRECVVHEDRVCTSRQSKRQNLGFSVSVKTQNKLPARMFEALLTRTRHYSWRTSQRITRKSAPP